jgi:dTDP-4-dehydrorhamnose reductase
VRILLTGKNGQVGSALASVLPALGELLATDRTELNVCDSESVQRAVQSARPDVIVNAAAYTAVDRAESDQALAFAANADGPRYLAEQAAKAKALLVHFSTDYVFNGEKGSPYTESDAPNPLNLYGRTKLAGEEAIRQSGCRFLIFRTSWVYSHAGGNFALTMLRLAREQKPLRVVDDQVGAPTSATMIAAATCKAIPLTMRDPALEGLYHLSAGGATTWCGFARTLLEKCELKAKVSAIRTEDYPTAARRPRYSLLDSGKAMASFGLLSRHWTAELDDVLKVMKRAGSQSGC